MLCCWLNCILWTSIQLQLRHYTNSLAALSVSTRWAAHRLMQSPAALLALESQGFSFHQSVFRKHAAAQRSRCVATPYGFFHVPYRALMRIYNQYFFLCTGINFDSKGSYIYLRKKNAAPSPKSIPELYICCLLSGAKPCIYPYQLSCGLSVQSHNT